MPISPSASSLGESLLTEFETQACVTRRFLERLPEDKLGWKPHPKSMSAGQLAYHLASVPAGVVRMVQSNPAQVPETFTFPQPTTCREIMDNLDASIVAVREALPRFDDEAMAKTWRLVSGEKELLAQPRAAFLRDIMLNHWYQHRGQFSVYLRLLNIPVPASWDQAPTSRHYSCKKRRLPNGLPAEGIRKTCLDGQISRPGRSASSVLIAATKVLLGFCFQ